ncbi:hypothetical protein EI94DRAFT_1786759 [Lactarius quietus]|nr:hypothetical protein EI94DRAFT_1786759 [Lactarius quietus]
MQRALANILLCWKACCKRVSETTCISTMLGGHATFPLNIHYRGIEFEMWYKPELVSSSSGKKRESLCEKEKVVLTINRVKNGSKSVNTNSIVPIANGHRTNLCSIPNIRFQVLIVGRANVGKTSISQQVILDPSVNANKFFGFYNPENHKKLAIL